MIGCPAQEVLRYGKTPIVDKPAKTRPFPNARVAAATPKFADSTPSACTHSLFQASNGLDTEPAFRRECATRQGVGMVRIITVSREFGSGGSEVARILSQRLDWKLIDDPFVAEIAQRANISPEIARRFDECVDPWFHRMFKALWHGGYEGVVSRGEVNAFDADAMARLWMRIISESAQMGTCVIVGRGAQCLLQDRPDAFHVSVFAHIEDRVRNLRGPLRVHVPPGADPRALALESDARRANYIRRYFGEDWKDYRLYHMVINSSVGFEAAAGAVLSAAGLRARESAASGVRPE